MDVSVDRSRSHDFGSFEPSSRRVSAESSWNGWILLGVLGLASACRSPPEESTPEPVSDLTRVSTYAITYDASGDGAIHGEAASESGATTGEIRWTGTLEVIAIEADAAGSYYELALVEYTRAELELLGQLIPLAGWTELPPVRFRRNDAGEVVEVWFEEPHDVVFQNFVSDILAEALPPLPPPGQTGWRTSSQNLLGRSRVAWSVEPAPGGGRVAHRTREAYESLSRAELMNLPGFEVELDSRFDYGIDSTGAIAWARGSDSFEVSTSAGLVETRRLELDLRRLGTREEPKVEDDYPWRRVDVESVAFGDTRVSDRARRSMLLQQVGETTVDDILDYGSVFGVLGRAKDHNGRFWSSIGLLELDPSAIPHVERRASSARSSPRTRGYLMDVLAGAGTRAAQLALIRVVNSTTTRSSSELVQAGSVTRLGFVELPEPELIEAAGEWYERHGQQPGAIGESSTLALGTAVGRGRAVPESRTVAKAFHDALRRGYQAATSAEIRRRHLLALGAVRYDADLPLFEAAATSTVSRVRAAVAAAMAQFPTLERERLLLDLVADEATIVQGGALSSLVSAKPSVPTARALADLLIDGRIRPFHFFMTFQALSALPDADMRRVVAYLDNHPDTASGVRELLRETTARLGTDSDRERTGSESDAGAKGGH